MCFCLPLTVCSHFGCYRRSREKFPDWGEQCTDLPRGCPPPPLCLGILTPSVSHLAPLCQLSFSGTILGGSDRKNSMFSKVSKFEPTNTKKTVIPLKACPDLDPKCSEGTIRAEIITKSIPQTIFCVTEEVALHKLIPQRIFLCNRPEIPRIRLCNWG